MDFFYTIIENAQYPFIIAFVLGLMTAISPCPLATNITAVGFISRNIEDRRKVFLSGLVYTLGRAISYSLIGIIIFLGASQMKVTMLFQGWGEKILGPVLIIIGIFMLGIIRLNIPGLSGLTEKVGGNSGKSYWKSLLLGILFALAFCPYSGVLYFAMLIPITVTSAGGLYLPIVFAIATGLPVIIFAWFLAYAVGNVGKVYNKIKSFEFWFRRIAAVTFILIGIYYIFLFYIKPVFSAQGI
jgi:cytochrome c-type biogenesis protein